MRTTPEEAVYKFAWASIVADEDLSAGTTITSKNIWALRPGTGEIAGYDFDKVVGKTLKKKVKYDEQLKWSDFTWVATTSKYVREFWNFKIKSKQ